MWRSTDSSGKSGCELDVHDIAGSATFETSVDIFDVMLEEDLVGFSEVGVADDEIADFGSLTFSDVTEDDSACSLKALSYCGVALVESDFGCPSGMTRLSASD